MERIKESAEQALHKDYMAFDGRHAPLRRLSLKPQEDTLGTQHPEFAEARIFELEDEVFYKTLDFQLPKPCPESLKTLHEELTRSHTRLLQISRRINNTHRAIEKPTVLEEFKTTFRREFQKIGLSIFGEDPRERDKNLMRDFLEAKSHYLHVARCYLRAYAMQVPAKKEAAETQSHKVEVIELAHLSHSIVRSAIHQLDRQGLETARRKDGSLVADHVYKVCVREMNIYLKEIEQAESVEKKAALWRKLKKAVIRAQLHDFLEDFAEVKIVKEGEKETITMFEAGGLKDKLDQFFKATRWQESIPLRVAGFTGPIHFFTDELWYTELLPELTALIKAPKGQRRGMFANKIGTLEEPLCTEALRTKLADREHNLLTLGLEKDAPTFEKAKKICETHDLTAFALTVAHDTQNPHLKGLIHNLLDIVLVEIHKLEPEVNALSGDQAKRELDKIEDTTLIGNTWAEKLATAKALFEAQKKAA